MTSVFQRNQAVLKDWSVYPIMKRKFIVLRSLEVLREKNFFRIHPQCTYMGG